MSKDEDQSPSCKVVLLGESGVGKTCIIGRYINGMFDENGMSTTGASFVGKTMTFDEYNKTIKFDIWDTAGQEKYRALTKIFYKDASIAVLVYDITRKESYDELKNYWYNQIKEHAPKKISIYFYNKNLLVIGIAANKSDLFDKEQVPEKEAREFAKEIGAIFKLTSAYNGSGVDDLFKTIGMKFIDPNFSDEEKVERQKRKDKNVVLQKEDKKEQTGKKKGCC